MAEKTSGGFEDIWLLGDLFGHSDDSTGDEELSQTVLDGYRILEKYQVLAVRGNWEHWLTHPERDARKQDQGKYMEQLAQRRELFGKRNNHILLDWLAKDTVRVFPEQGAAEFTLFHGCSYPCYGNSDYQLHPCECYLFPRNLNIVTRGLFGNEDHLKTPHFLFGHTHTPGFFTYSAASKMNMWQFFRIEMDNHPISYGDSSQRYGINPGSAGIETRRFPRTAVLLDTAEKTFMYLVDKEG